ncbi:hypothetical protein CRG98_006023 [Punica granatum]|uniref:Uncharacterized protein n=1 Tax=Punica granatum TaxID=22663 RepID=A0A2I0KYN3_PUNGR|nr:hypothetical protein CRG98_006023 [Punica granatum]
MTNVRCRHKICCQKRTTSLWSPAMSKTGFRTSYEHEAFSHEKCQSWAHLNRFIAYIADSMFNLNHGSRMHDQSRFEFPPDSTPTQAEPTASSSPLLKTKQTKLHAKYLALSFLHSTITIHAFNAFWLFLMKDTWMTFILIFIKTIRVDSTTLGTNDHHGHLEGSIGYPRPQTLPQNAIGSLRDDVRPDLCQSGLSTLPVGSVATIRVCSSQNSPNPTLEGQIRAKLHVLSARTRVLVLRRSAQTSARAQALPSPCQTLAQAQPRPACQHARLRTPLHIYAPVTMPDARARAHPRPARPHARLHTPVHIDAPVTVPKACACLPAHARSPARARALALRTSARPPVYACAYPRSCPRSCPSTRARLRPNAHGLAPARSIAFSHLLIRTPVHPNVHVVHPIESPDSLTLL